MSQTSEAPTQAAPPHVQLIQMGMVFWVSRLVYAAARLGVADHLADGAKTPDGVAKLTRTDAPTMARFLRTLGSLGLVLSLSEAPGSV